MGHPVVGTFQFSGVFSVVLEDGPIRVHFHRLDGFGENVPMKGCTRIPSLEPARQTCPAPVTLGGKTVDGHSLLQCRKDKVTTPVPADFGDAVQQRTEDGCERPNRNPCL